VLLEQRDRETALGKPQPGLEAPRAPAHDYDIVSMHLKKMDDAAGRRGPAIVSARVR
jgi:hypothetical protein